LVETIFMRKPRQAPTILECLKTVQDLRAEKLGELLTRGESALASDRYLHWDDLQYRQPPDGLSRDQWWFLLKFGRQNLKQTLSLADKNDALFSYTLVPPIPKQLHEIDLRLGGQIKMPEEVINPETRDEYYVSSLIEEAITSSQLEGATTTRRVAKEMLRTGRAPQDRSERMILDNYLTMRRIGELKAKPLSTELIFEIHRLVTHDTLDESTAAGRFRSEDEDEHIAVFDTDDKVMHDPPPASTLVSRVQKICDFANQTEPFVHPVIRSIILHFMLGYDHPFVDGNGRTCLLYTSPSPRDLSTYRMPSSA